METAWAVNPVSPTGLERFDTLARLIFEAG